MPFLGVQPAEGALTSDHITDGIISTSKLAADAVTAAKIGDDVLDSEHYTDGSVDGAHIANDAIDSQHYVDASIDTAHIATNAIDGTLTKDALIADYSDVTITASDLIMYGDATDSNNTKRDTVQGILDLTSGGAWEFVSTNDVTSMASTVAVTGIDTSADVWKVVITGMHNSSNAADFYMRHSTDGGSSYVSSASAYMWVVRGNISNTTTLHVDYSTGDTQMLISGNDPIDLEANTATSNSNWEITIYDPNETSHSTNFFWTGSSNYGTSYHVCHTGAASVDAAEDTDALQFYMDSGNLLGRFSLYKLKHS